MSENLQHKTVAAVLVSGRLLFTDGTATITINNQKIKQGAKLQISRDSVIGFKWFKNCK